MIAKIYVAHETMRSCSSKRLDYILSLLATLLIAWQVNVPHIHNDISGSPLAATDASGKLLWKENYRPYGERVANSQTATASNALWFTGKPQDAQTGLSYMGARYYNPMLGRFMGVDPKGVDLDNLHSFNRYTYANNNPYKYVDPDGRMALPYAVVGLVATGAAIITWASVPQSQKDAIARNTLLAVQGLRNWIFSDSTDNSGQGQGQGQAEAGAGGAGQSGAKGTAPPLPGGLVGTQDGKGGQRGGRHNSGPLAPEHGGTGNADQDFNNLTGGRSAPDSTGDYPPGTQVGENGVRLRPAKGLEGPRIDIPANGAKPHETLHYPPIP